MLSPYEVSLNREIDQSTNITDKSFKLGELASYLGRLGHYDRAEEMIASIRTEFGDGQSGRVTVMLMIAESHVSYFRDLGKGSRDRMARAQLLSVAAKDAPLTALTSAWLAHFDYNTNSFESLARNIKTCLDTISSADLGAACRLSLTLANAFLYSGNTTSSKHWYAKAHKAAVAQGDHSSIAALTYNRAAFGAFCARIEEIDAPPDDLRIAAISGEVKSAVNYQAVAQLRSFQNLIDNTEIAAKMLRREYSSALPSINSLLEKDAKISQVDHSTNLKCDQILCQVAVGNFAGNADDISRRIDSRALDDCLPDDRALGYHSLSLAAKMLGDGVESMRLTELATLALAEHRASLARLAAIIQPYSSESFVSGLRW